MNVYLLQAYRHLSQILLFFKFLFLGFLESCSLCQLWSSVFWTLALWLRFTCFLWYCPFPASVCVVRCMQIKMLDIPYGLNISFLWKSVFSKTFWIKPCLVWHWHGYGRLFWLVFARYIFSHLFTFQLPIFL